MPDITAAIAHPHDTGPHGAQYIAPDAHGRNFYAIDRQFQDLLSLYMEPALLKQMTPHFERLGELAGNQLDDLAHDRRQASPRPAAARPLRPRRGLDRLSPVLPRDGEDRLRGVRHARDDPSRRRAGPRRARSSAGEVRHHLSLRAGRVRPDVPGLGLRHLELHHQALRLGGAEEAAARPAAEPGPGDDAQGHAVHDREGGRFRRRRARDRGRAHRYRPRRRRALEALSARSGSAATPTPVSRSCWPGRAARRPARRGSACSPCRGGWRTAAATAIGSCG